MKKREVIDSKQNEKERFPSYGIMKALVSFFILGLISLVTTLAMEYMGFDIAKKLFLITGVFFVLSGFVCFLLLWVKPIINLLKNESK